MSNKKKIYILAGIYVFAIILTFPVLSKTPSHPDEHQFYFNAFKIMAGEELHNYLHIAVTEYVLAGFLLIVNLFTTSGVNFPQGDPTAVTYYYGKILGFILYIVTAILGGIILQRKDRELKLRTIIFTLLFFGSISMFERFIRINSDSFTIFIFLCFVILSLWQHSQKASVVELFLLNLVFIFLGTFTNLKSLYLMLPLATLNLVSPFIWYEKTKIYQGHRLPALFRLILYGIGVVFGCLILWTTLAPKPFNYRNFWYGMKKTIVHGTQFDFDFPDVSHNSGSIYIYDLLVHQINTYVLISILVLLAIALIIKKKDLIKETKEKVLGQLNLLHLKDGNLYNMTELILLISFLSYFIGVSTRVVHWSRWGAPLGILALMILSTFVEKLLESIFGQNWQKRKGLLILLAILIIWAWVPRIALNRDLHKTAYSKKDDFSQTTADIQNLINEKGIKQEEARNKVAWFTGHTPNIIDNISFEQVVEEDYKDVEYLLWPHWNIGLVYTEKSVDKETHLQRAFVNTYAKDIEYRFPTFLASYSHKTKQFAWDTLGITWHPEIDSLVEEQYAVLTLKRPIDGFELHYTLGFNDISHYTSPFSRVFNLKNLNDSYMFAPCYTYDAVKFIHSGEWVEPPPEIGVRARTAGLYCHSVRFRILPKGVYFIRVSGLPKNSDHDQKVYYNLGNFNWDLNTNTANFVVGQTTIPGELGVATKEKWIPNLKFEILYILNDEIINAIDEAIKESEKQGTASESTEAEALDTETLDPDTPQ